MEPQRGDPDGEETVSGLEVSKGLLEKDGF